MELTAELKGFDRALLLFDEKKVKRAGYRAINDVSKSVRTAADRAVRSRYEVKANVTKKRIVVLSGATPRTLRAVIMARSRPLGLEYFPTRQIKNLAGGGVAVRSGNRKFDEYRKGSKGQRGLSAKILKGGGYRHIPRGFALRGSRGHQSFRRRFAPGKWGELEGTKTIRMITVASMFNQSGAVKATNQAIDDNWQKRFNYQLDKELGR